LQGAASHSRPLQARCNAPVIQALCGWLIVAASLPELILTASIGILGFGGVIYTIRENARLSRDERRDVRTHLKSTLRHALIVELGEARRMYEERVADRDVEEGTDALLPAVCPRAIYDGSIAEIRVLTPKEIECVIRAYALMSELPGRLRLLPRTPEEAAWQLEGYLHIPNAHLENAAQMHENFLETINEAIQALERNSATENDAT